MALVLFDTRRRGKHAFAPAEPGHVRMYVCGITPYGPSHLGHARCYIVFDVLHRWLEVSGYTVNYVRNFTDIDDKIITSANEYGVDVGQWAQRFIDTYASDMAELQVLGADSEPRVTDTIPQIIELISILVAKNHAYVAEDGVWFDVSSASEKYGQLTGQNYDDVKAGASGRIGSSGKRDHRDFSLWKAAKIGEPSWPSPWMDGRPGWHIECSAMSLEALGESFDIHGGGHDLRFPHHECEIMQSECSTGVSPVASWWLHNGFVNVDGEKMSKSLGNYWTIRDALDAGTPALGLRFGLLHAHYRSPIDLSESLIEESVAHQKRIEATYRASIRASSQVAINRQVALPRPDNESSSDLAKVLATLEEFGEEFARAMDDDLNTREAITAVIASRRIIEGLLHGSELDVQDTASFGTYAVAWLEETAGAVLGILPPRSTVESAVLEHAARTDAIRDEVETLIAERSQARDSKDWAQADAIRDRLAEMGVLTQDGPDGTTWDLENSG